ncbi:LacI family DNA-binding transcriptional regulator [Streptomyces alanosinicus]|uniref:LacI family DNA-binding transcriptional regulator n=1 Tax=Streptomyces alanosinicus TaxID=68171 RepID=UPI003570C521
MAHNNEGAAPDGEQAAQSGGPASVTIAYIAESAGVSLPTLSKVLNGRSGVSDGTRARVEEHLHIQVVPRSAGDRLALPWTPQQEIAPPRRQRRRILAARRHRGTGRQLDWRQAVDRTHPKIPRTQAHRALRRPGRLGDRSSAVLGCPPDCPNPERNRYLIYVVSQHGVPVLSTLADTVTAAPHIIEARPPA